MRTHQRGNVQRYATAPPRGRLIVGPPVARATLLRRLQEQNVNFVLGDRTGEGIEADIVRSDSFAGATQLAEHLLAKRDEPCQRLCS